MARKKPAKKAKSKKKSAGEARREEVDEEGGKEAGEEEDRQQEEGRQQEGRKTRQARRREESRSQEGGPHLCQGYGGQADEGGAEEAQPLRKQRAKAAPKLAAGKKPNLDRPRKTVADIHGIPSSLDANRGASAAKSGRADMQDRLSKNTSASPALTSGDFDADWESADAVGDEAPGGDNPTPDQDVVDDIGRALGVEYEDDEELQGGAEITDRDRHRWELDPASKDDDEDSE